MQMYRSISILILLQEIGGGTVVEIAIELERSMQRPLSWQETEGTVASSRFPIHYNTFYMVHASACDILSTVILAVIIILFYDTLLIIGATY